VDVVRSTTGSRLGGALALTLLTASASYAAEGPPTSIRAYKPEADTYVTAAQPRRNFGHTRTLHTDGAPPATVYLRFRVERLDDKVESVTLLLHAEAGARGFQVRRVGEDEWRERTLTYRNAPRLSLRYASSKPVRRGKWSAVDVTPLVADENDDHVSLAITTRSPLGVVFASRETNDGPRLVISTTRKGRGSNSAKPSRLPAS
jgi:hypothetical protein